MSTFALRPRAGLGPGVDPHFDARVGRLAYEPASEHGLDSGYIELTDQPWDYLVALMEVLYRATPAESGIVQRLAAACGLHSRPRLWTHIAALRYLTTDARTGIALPLHDCNPRGPHDKDFRAALARLEQGTAGRLRSARTIGLTVSFRLGDTAAAAFVPLLQPAALRRVLRPGARRARADLRQFLCGGASPWLGPFAGPLERSVGARRYPAQAVGTSGLCKPQLQRATQELRSGLPAPALPGGYGTGDATGLGTLVGFVDFGCDFAHPLFRLGTDQARSRIVELWDQNADPENAPPALGEHDVVVEVDAQHVYRFGYGRRFSGAQIDDALGQWLSQAPNDPEGPYRLLGYDPHDHHYTRRRPGAPEGPPAAHGLQVMQIAVGGARPGCADASAPTHAVQGVAPQAGVVFVQVRQHRAADGRRTLDLADVLDAVAFIFHVAEREAKPCVVNISLNTMSGAHDGDGYFERQLAALLRSGIAGPSSRGRAVVIAAGNLPPVDNQQRTWQHLRESIPAGGRFEFEWLVTPEDETRNMVEIWYDAVDRWLQVTLVPTAGPELGPIGPGDAAEILVDNQLGASIIGSRWMPYADGDLPGEGALAPSGDMQPGRQMILLEVDPEVTGRTSWKVVLQAVDASNAVVAGRSPVLFDAWLERDDEGQSGICRGDAMAPIQAKDRSATIGTLSCSREALVVGAYTTRASQVDEWGYSGRGPSRRGDLRKPDLSAPGHDVFLVNSPRNAAAGTCARASGTSIAAPFVAGTIACMYEAWPEAPLAAVREALLTSVRPPPGTIADTSAGAAATPPWSPVFGYGRLDPARALAELKAIQLYGRPAAHLGAAPEP